MKRKDTQGERHRQETKRDQRQRVCECVCERGRRYTDEEKGHTGRETQTRDKERSETENGTKKNKTLCATSLLVLTVSIRN